MNTGRKEEGRRTFLDDFTDEDFGETAHDGEDGGRDGLLEDLVDEL